MKDTIIQLFIHITDNMRMINTCKDKYGRKCVVERGETLFAVQVQKSFFGIRYWRTLYQATDYNEALDRYKCYVDGYPKEL